MWREKVKKRKGIFSKRCYKQFKEKRTWWRWDDIDQGLRPNRSSHNTVFTAHAIWLFTKLSGESISFILKWWEKASASRKRHWPHHRCIALFGTSTVSEHPKLREHRRQCIESVALRPAPPWAAPLVNLNNSTHQTDFGVVSSLFSFCFFSCSFLHPCSSINPTLHHLYSTHTSSSFSDSISTPKHWKGASTSP